MPPARAGPSQFDRENIHLSREERSAGARLRRCTPELRRSRRGANWSVALADPGHFKGPVIPLAGAGASSEEDRDVTLATLSLSGSRRRSYAGRSPPDGLLSSGARHRAKLAGLGDIGWVTTLTGNTSWRSLCRKRGCGREQPSGGCTMYPGLQIEIRPCQPAIIMAQSGETVSYAELERRSNRLAHFLRASGLDRLDHYAIFMENNGPLCRMLQRGRTRRALLHLHQFISDAGRGGLHPRQQRVEDPDHLDGQTRCRAKGNDAVSADRAVSCRGRSGRRRQGAQPRRGGEQIS